MRPVRIVPLLTVGLAACFTPAIGTRIDEPVRPAAPVAVERLAVLPVTADLGSGNASPAVEAAVLEELASAWPDLVVVAPSEARRRLGGREGGAALAQMIRDYETAGVVDLPRVDSVGAALDVPFFLQLRVGLAESTVIREELFSEDLADQDRREVVLVARLWSRTEPGPIWEGAVRADSETSDLSGDLPEQAEMVREVTARLLARMPIAGARGSENGEEPDH